MSLVNNPSHPGEILKYEFLDELGVSAIALAKRINVPRTRIERLIAGKTAVTTDTALRLSRVLGTTPQFWINLQINYDLAKASKETDLSDIQPLVAA